MPYEDFLDLALIYQYTVGGASVGVHGTIKILNEHLDLLHVSQEELKAAALVNTKRMHPPVIYTMEAVLNGNNEQLREEFLVGEESARMYILTNTAGIHGAASLVYKECLRGFAKTAGGGFYILPSSIHEVIFVPDAPDLSAKKLAAIVKEVNTKVVHEREVLSDQVYYFEPEADRIKRLGTA